MPRRGAQDSRSFNVPTRVPKWITLTHPTVVSVVNYPVAPGLTFIKALALVVMFGVLLYAGFYQSDPFSDPGRSGWIAAALFPIVAGIACKNNVFSWFSGVGYEKVIRTTRRTPQCTDCASDTAQFFAPIRRTHDNPCRERAWDWLQCVIASVLHSIVVLILFFLLIAQSTPG